ncbi:thioredoxin family protein [Flavobacteriaceae bacterium F89]|uniref:Thioredoxin family protein n=1 Tax=Cerina litoralis TaxID=2874477 RepID=A0AAE3EZV0_9FLAO|nr:thioredoxin family protein [Cerina litoralis]MCG2462681.1 thioredoxin family protein [Cerina litoralis]
MNIQGPIFTYAEFYGWMQSLVAAGKTSGNNQTEVLADFTALNKRRMKRLNRTLSLEPDLLLKLESIEKPQNWLVITEAWCGDSAQCLPVIGKMASYSEKIELSIVLRDENPQLMEVYHTNGSKSIPKLISFDENEKELFLWGPRPEPAQEILSNWKKEPQGRNWEEFEKELHTWYAKDKTKTLQREFLQLFNEL